MRPSAFSEHRSLTSSDDKLVLSGSAPSMAASRRLSDSTPRHKKNLLVDKNIYQRQSPLTQRSLVHSTSERRSVDMRKPGATLRDSTSSRAGTPVVSPGASGRLRVRDGDEKATISRIWEALCLPEGERCYAWKILKEDTAAQKAYGCRLRIALGFKKEYTDLVHQRQVAIRSFLMLLNENHTKASIGTRRRIAELVLNIRSLTSKVTHILEKARAQCKMPLNLPLFSTEAINQNCTESWYAQLLTEDIFSQKVVTKLLLLIGFFDDPDRGEFASITIVSEAIAAFYRNSIIYGVWTAPDINETNLKGQKTDQTGTFTQADVSLFLLLGLPILTLQPMDFTSLPEMLSQFLEAASGAPDMPLQSVEIKQLLIKEGQRITDFRNTADEYARQGKGIVIIPVQSKDKEADQFEVYSTRNATSQRSASGSLFTQYHTPTDGSSMPKSIKPAASGALPKKRSKALTDGNIHAILKKIQGELSGPPRPLSNLDHASVSEPREDEHIEATHSYEQCVHSSGLYGTPDAPSLEPSLDEDRPTYVDTVHVASLQPNNDECQCSSDNSENDSFSIPPIVSVGGNEDKSNETSVSEEPNEAMGPDDLQQPKPPVSILVEDSSTIHKLIIYKTKFTSPGTVSGSSYDLAIALS